MEPPQGLQLVQSVDQFRSFVSQHDAVFAALEAVDAAGCESRSEAAALMDQHAAINASIQDGDAQGARRAMQRHLAYFDEVLRARADAARRAEVVEQRNKWSNRHKI